MLISGLAADLFCVKGRVAGSIVLYYWGLAEKL